MLIAALLTIVKLSNTHIVHKLVDKQNVVYTYNETLFSLKKKGSADTCYNMNKPWHHYTKKNQVRHRRTNVIWFYLHEMSRVVKFTDTGRVLVITVGEGWGMDSCCWMAQSFSLGGGRYWYW